MDQDTIIYGGLALAVLAFVANASAKKKKGPDFLDALRSFKAESSWREKTFHIQLKKYLESELAPGPLVKVITEAGIPGSTAKVDVYAIYGDVDYLITVKKGLSSQKVMTLVGEVTDVLHHWRAEEGRKSVLVVLLYGETPTGGDDHFTKLLQLVTKAAKGRPDVTLEFVAVGP